MRPTVLHHPPRAANGAMVLAVAFAASAHADGVGGFTTDQVNAFGQHDHRRLRPVNAR